MPAMTSYLIRMLSRPFGSELCLFLALSVLSLVVCIFESMTYSDDIVRETPTSTTDFDLIKNSEDGVLEYSSLFEIKSVFVSSVLCLFSGIFLLNKLSFFIFFGKLSDTERIHLSRMFFKFVLLRFVILSGAISVSRLVSIFGWLVWFGSLMLLHSCALLITSRCGQFSASSRISVREWFRISFALLFLVVGNWYLLIGGLTHRFILSEVNPLNQSEISKEALGRYGSIWKTPTALAILAARITGKKAHFYGTIDVVAYITAESLLLFCRSARLIIGLLFQAYDRWSLVNGRSWPQQANVLYYVEFIHIVFLYAIEILHYLHLLLWSRIFSIASLIVFLHIRCTYSLLVDRIRRHLFHRRLSRFIKLSFSYCALDKSKEVKTPDSEDAECNTTASLGGTPKDALEVCAICWEPLVTWRRLPCRHDFHEYCLRSWLEQNPTCPTCRRDLGIPPTLQSNPNRNLQPNQLALGFLLRNFVRPRQREFNLPQAGQPSPASMTTSASAPHVLGVRNRGLFAAAVGLNLGVSIGSDPIVTAAAQTVARETAPGRSVAGATFPTVSEVAGPSSSTSLTVASPAVQSQQLPRTDAAVPEDADHVRRRSFHFDGSRYFSWLPSLHVELSESNLASPSSVSPSIAPPETSRSIAEETTAGPTVRRRTLDDGQRSSTDLGSGNGDSYLRNRRREMLERARQRFIARNSCHS
ncbi:unnamed protein product [Dicrocoelium dendriticum]|nr:unnamed protein product [Dicrocoelium dendriticum]